MTKLQLQQIDAIVVAAAACQAAKASQEGTCQAGVGSPAACRNLEGVACQEAGVMEAHSQVGVVACLLGIHILAEAGTGHLDREI